MTDQEIQFHRSFLSLELSLKIWNEDYTHQNTRGGPPGRQYKIDSNSDPVFNYHVRQGPHWPSKPPGDKAAGDSKYNALLARDDGTFEPLVITTKRGMTGQNFLSAATPWEYTNSVLCPFGGRFIPVVNSMMEVTGHYARVLDVQLIRPAGISFTDPAECIAKEVTLFLWIHETRKENTAWVGSNGSVSNLPAPEGWVSFNAPRIWNGGIDVVVLPNGEVVGAKGRPYSSNNGTTYSVISPLDFWAPGSRMVSAGIRGLTNRISAAAVRGIRALRIPTKKLAESTVIMVSGNTLTGMAVTTGTLPFYQAGRRTILMGEDMAEARRLITSKVESGFYDVVIHGDDLGFGILVKTIPHPDPTKVRQVWREVSVREVADLIRPHLKPGDQIRLVACKSGGHGGPAQQLANELKNHTVWAPNKSLSVEQGVFKKVNGEYIRDPIVKFSKETYVPLEGGKFYSFEPQPHRGAATLAGKRGKVPGNVVKGEINPAR